MHVPKRSMVTAVSLLGNYLMHIEIIIWRHGVSNRMFVNGNILLSLDILYREYTKQWCGFKS
jgi:hypothetical protein